MSKCKELSIIARSSSSNISDEDAEKIKNSFSKSQIVKEKSDRDIVKRTGSKVTIRRKKAAKVKEVVKEKNSEESDNLTRQTRVQSKPIPEAYDYYQSMHQSFFFVESATIDGAPLEDDDLIIAYNDNVVIKTDNWNTLNICFSMNILQILQGLYHYLDLIFFQIQIF